MRCGGKPYIEREFEEAPHTSLDDSQLELRFGFRSFDLSLFTGGLTACEGEDESHVGAPCSLNTDGLSREKSETGLTGSAWK